MFKKFLGTYLKMTDISVSDMIEARQNTDVENQEILVEPCKDKQVSAEYYIDALLDKNNSFSSDKIKSESCLEYSEDHVDMKDEPLESENVFGEGLSFGSSDVDDDETGKSHINKKSKKTKQKSLSCEVCHKIFSKTNCLNRHKLLHSGVKPFSCDICTYTFSQKQHLKKHKERHTKSPYFCSSCLRMFADEEKCTKHKTLCPSDQNLSSTGKSYRGRYRYVIKMARPGSRGVFAC